MFYQHFTLSLLELKACVGWHWFKHADNDLAEPGTDPSNRDSNEGIVTARYMPDAARIDEMRLLNERVYRLADYFDRAATQRKPDDRVEETPRPGVI